MSGDPHPGDTSDTTRAPGPAAIVGFWSAAGLDRWFVKDSLFDDDLRRRFLDDHLAAARRERDGWCATPEGALALLILLDQLPRNIFRGSAHMYATDGLALDLARRFLLDGTDALFEPDLRMLFYLPFTHSEMLEDQDVSVERRRLLGPKGERRAREHRDIIRRFGRFPHRNACLERRSTPGEESFLQGDGFKG